MTYRNCPRLAPLALFALLAACGAPPPAEDPPPPGATAHEGAAFEITEVRPGIWHAVGTGVMSVGANAAIVDLGESLLLVDSHITPAAAWVLLQELSPLTPKPVRYVVNTHFHFDHIHGNQVFGEEVEILGHEATYTAVAGGGSNSGTAWDAFVGTLPEQIATLESRLEAAAEADRADLEEALRMTRAYQEATASVTPVPPTITLDRRMTLHRGGQEIQLLFMGPGHTAGDVVVFMPGQKVLMTGDLIPFGLPFMGDGYPEWGETIRQFAELDFDLVLPGHGPPFEDKAKLEYLAAYLDDFWTQAEAAHGDGVSAEEAAGAIDLTAHAERFPSVTEPGAPQIAVERAYRLFDVRALTTEQ
jgi:glyoxylase-like metal-dependent hydrolase (beta-lactamase superfamily II)